ncbi:ABC transporter substrate-binding protein [Nocardioides pacificus]
MAAEDGAQDMRGARVTSRREEGPGAGRGLAEGRRPVRRALFAGLALTLAATTAACTQEDDEPGAAPSPSASAEPTRLTFGVYGPDEELTAFTDVVEAYNSLADNSTVSLRTWSDHETAVSAMRSEAQVPDVFFATRDDLAWLREEELSQPVDELLDERGVDFGDVYSRDALQAFSGDNRLQCMPYGISPMVIFYNRDLVDFDVMRERGLDAPSSNASWSLEEFTAAAEMATRPRRGTRGLHIEPTVTGLAPFIVSGSGNVFNDATDPTSLAFSDESTQGALEQTLQLLRTPYLTLTDAQLSKADPVEWFKRGRVGMIAGYRSLVPELRTVPGLNFDVMPMPTLDEEATLGDITALCMSADAADSGEAADFMTYALSSIAVERVVRAGYLVPANLEVAESDVFLQPGRMPEGSAVFNRRVRDITMLPVIDDWEALEEAVAADLRQLVTVPVLELGDLTTQIDEASQRVLDPDWTEDDATGDESGDESGDPEE